MNALSEYLAQIGFSELLAIMEFVQIARAEGVTVGELDQAVNNELSGWEISIDLEQAS